jgi:hypothetical protein
LDIKGEELKMKTYNNIHSFIRDYYEKHPNGHYFDPDTLKFFGERLSDMRIYKAIEVKEDYQGTKHDCYVVSRLQRKHPNGPKRTLVYFDVKTLEDI